MGNARFMLVLAAAFVGISCATSGNPPATSSAPLAVSRKEEIPFMGHRLVVEWDAAGKATTAQAYDGKNEKVPTHVVPMGDVKVCAPQPVQPGAAGPQCEPFSFLPEGASFKTGANSICWYYRNGQLVYYYC